MGRGEFKPAPKTRVGEDDIHTYKGVTVTVVNRILRALAAEGMTVTGKNPWDVDVGKHDVKLRAVWDPATQLLGVSILDHDWLANSLRIWGEIDPLMNEAING